MAARVTITKQVATSLLSLRRSDIQTGDLATKVNVQVPRGTAGVLGVRTSNSVGTLTAANGNHGIGTGDKFDLYWSGGHRVSVVAGTVSGTSIPITGGDIGEDLPIAATIVVISKQVPFAFVVEMDEVLMMAFLLSYPASIVLVPHDASVRFDQTAQSLHSFVDLTPNIGVISDLTTIDLSEATGLTQARYLTGLVSNPSIKANASFRALYLTSGS